MRIIKYAEEYRDDLIFMILQAKDALGRIPRLNEDLLNINGNYLNKGDMFWIAVDENNRVIGSIGYTSVLDSTEVFLHRLFVKADKKHSGIGTLLLHNAEDYIKSKGKTLIRVHLGTPKEQWFESYLFYAKNGYMEYELEYMKKIL